MVLVTSRPQSQTLLSVLLMTAQMAETSAIVCAALVKTSILESLLRISIIFPAFSQSSVDGAEPWLSLLNACRQNLHHLYQSCVDPDALLNHPVCALWQACAAILPSISTVKDQISARSSAWRRASNACCTRRVRMIYISALWIGDDTESIEACADIVEFTRCVI